MGQGKKPIIGIVATLSAIFLIALLAGLFTGATADSTTLPAPVIAQVLKDHRLADENACKVDCAAAPRLIAPADSRVLPASKLTPVNQSHVKYNTITDRADTLDRHPVLMDNPSAHNPSYKELMAFLKSDDTVKNKYDYPNYTCANFVVELQHKAESKGIHCGYAGINFRGKETGHAINVFPTADAGLVYVDLTGGKMIVSKNLRQGMKYYNMGVIESLKIYW